MLSSDVLLLLLFKTKTEGKCVECVDIIHFRMATEKKAFYFRHLGKTLPLLSQKGGGG